MNKRIFLLSLCIVFYPVCAQAAEMYTMETVERVISGDTFKLKSGKKIRLIGVDAPENEPNQKAREDSLRTGQTLDELLKKGKAATEWVKSRLEGKRIFLKYDKKRKGDRGEELVYAYLYDEALFYGGIVERQLFEDVQFEWWQLPERGKYVFLNATIIKGGYATPEKIPPNVKYADWFERAFWEAKEASEGLWNVDYFEVPCTEEGRKIGICAGCLVRCCKPSMPIFDLVVDGKCQKEPVIGSGGYCSHCGNNICESEHLEDSCNCPRDCK
ncbi:MAG: thermonuclease family protein [Candidatus Omnitrophica bacterium]|nr:thermonuclease family protein [Candidatus Omnitrophota bacterium]